MALSWQALQWPDGTRYEGLTRDGRMHSHGVVVFPNKDRYEGQFQDGVMHGAGVYVWSDGTIYRGDWTGGTMHGCGTLLRKEQPGGQLQAAEGKFCGSEFVGDVMPCSTSDGLEAAVEADVAAYQARSFTQWRQQPGQPGQQRRLQPAQHRQPPPLGGGQVAGLDEAAQEKLQGLLQGLASQPVRAQQPQQRQHNAAG